MGLELRTWAQRRCGPTSRVIADQATCRVSVYPNAGLPDQMGEYRESPEVTAKLVGRVHGQRLGERSGRLLRDHAGAYCGFSSRSQAARTTPDRCTRSVDPRGRPLNMVNGMTDKQCDYLGVPPSQMRPGSRFPLQVRARIIGLAGFPLQSLTRVKRCAVLLVIGATVGCTSGSEKSGPDGSWEITALEEPQCLPCPEGMMLNKFMGRELFVGGLVRIHGDSLLISPHRDSTELRFRFEQEGSKLTLEGSDWIYSFQMDSISEQHMSWTVRQAVTYPVGDSMPDNELRVLFERRIP
jgi:hypothetical protein